MKLLLCLLLYGSIRTAQAGTFSLNGTEGRGVSLMCGNESKVVWSKGADGGRSAILTAEGGVITQKHRVDPGNRYRVLGDSSLVIENLSLSDSGIYYCNTDHIVNLMVYPAPPAAHPASSTGVSPVPPDNHSTTASPQPPLPTIPPTTGTTASPPPSPTTPSPTTDGIKIALAVLAAVLLIVTALLLLRCYSRRKAAEARTPDRVYETVNGTAPTTQPGGNEYEFDSDPSASAAPKEYEAVYLLAGDPDVIKLGLKNQSAAPPLAPQSTETTPSEALYSTIQAVDV